MLSAKPYVFRHANPLRGVNLQWLALVAALVVFGRALVEPPKDASLTDRTHAYLNGYGEIPFLNYKPAR